MKLKVTEIEATADDLKASNSLAEALNNQLRNILCPLPRAIFAEDDEMEEQE